MSPTPTLVGHAWCVTGGWRTTREAEHALEDLDLRAGTVATVFVPSPDEPGVREVGLVGVMHPAELPEGARAFRFEGLLGLPRRLAVADLLASTAIGRVAGLGGTPVQQSDVLDTQDFLRPTVEDGVLVLRVRPAVGDVHVPFEQPDPTPCCADHL